jgi:2-C-methyl-D-erythritol 4-phosphate cytidylyltransferase / 2-C-methyl-D-erythritol 2,4-cyclodiphosphate synthase
LRTATLILAAGRGSRASPVTAKQYAVVGGMAVLARAVAAFLRAPGIDLIQVVIAADAQENYRAALAGVAESRLLAPVVGGLTRQHSVLCGLRALVQQAPDRVLIHDAARPFVSSAVIAGVLAGLRDAPAAIPAIPLADTLKAADAANRITATLPRAGLWRAQTPQGFRFQEILDAHEKAHAEGRGEFTDDAALAEWANVPVVMVMGSEENRKLTTAADLAAAEALVPCDVRTGQGFDVHRLIAGDHLWLCGVRLVHDRALVGHSDADVALHALTDALLGAIGEGDIGEHFPDTDARWRGAPSHLFVAEALRRIRLRGGQVNNVDITILCERPRIAPHRGAMRTRLAELLGIDIARVGVKATTTEGLGFTGRGEGIAALANATVVLRPPSAP